MQEEIKKKILDHSREHISSIRQKIEETIKYREAKGKVIKKALIGISFGDALVQSRIMGEARVKDVYNRSFGGF